MGVDAWTRTAYERKSAARAKAPKRGKSLGDHLNEAPGKIKDMWNGEHKKCHCGCGKKADAFRDGKMYASHCVGRGSGWNKAGLPQDRTPPQTWRRRRDLNRSSRELDRDSE